MSLRHRFQGLQTLLGENSRLLEIMADLEVDLRFLPAGTVSLAVHLESLIEGTLLLIEDLNRLAEGRFRALYGAHQRIAREIRREIEAPGGPRRERWALPLAEVTLGQAPETGAKAARLGELRRLLPEHTLDGFVVPATAYQAWMAAPALAREMRALLEVLETSSDGERVRAQTRRTREAILGAALHPAIERALRDMVETRFSRVRSWAVRSSAVGEDGALSFAGQFESVLGVPPAELASAYRRVVASRFSDRAVTYRHVAGLLDAQTPMAVLFLPLVEARSAGVLYTRDPSAPSADEIVVSSTWGLAADLVGGKAEADLFRLARRSPHALVASRIARKAGRPAGEGAAGSADREAPSLQPAELEDLAEVGLRIEAHFGAPQDIEWAIDRSGRFWILQSRALAIPSVDREISPPSGRPYLSGGMTIFPGRAVAPALVVASSDSIPRPEGGVILVVPQATPALGAAIPFLAGVIAERGHPTSHAATLLRELAVPSLFEVTGATERISSGAMIGLDATMREVHLGDPWPDVRQRTAVRLGSRTRPGRSPIHELVLALNLTDPMSRKFRPEGCRSIHDLVRFIHEKAVTTFFEVGDREARDRLGSSRQLETPVPLNIHVLDIGGALPPPGPERRRKKVQPAEIRSVPFQALWRGMSHPEVRWSGRRDISLRGFASVMASSLGQEMGSVRRLGEANYLLVAPDYLNLNIKLAYHYALVDALVGPAVENNYVNFRFRGGGAARERRDLRARFLTEVLRRARFAVDCRGDLVTAWLRRYPQSSSEQGLELLGKLTVCSRQLDMLMDSESAVRYFTDRFLAGDYQAFA
jgi:pyruvate,water dikinase